MKKYSGPPYEHLEIEQPPNHKLTLVRYLHTGNLFLYQYERAPRNEEWSLVSVVKVPAENTAALVGFIARTAQEPAFDPYDNVQWGAFARKEGV